MGIEALLIGGLIASQAATMSQGGGGEVSIPTASAAAAVSSKTAKTAKPVKQLTESEKMNKRLAASSLTRDWGKLTLNKPGLLGVTE